MSDLPSFPGSPVVPLFPGGPGSPCGPSFPGSPGSPTHTQSSIVMISGFAYKPKDYQYSVSWAKVSGQLKSMNKAKVQCKYQEKSSIQIWPL